MKKGLLRIKVLGVQFQPEWQHPTDYIIRISNGGQIADLVPQIITTETIWLELMSESLEVIITNRHADSAEVGFAQVKLTEMLKYQETLHKVHVHLSIRDRTHGWIDREAGLVTLQILFSSKPLNGNITVMVHAAELTRDTQIISKMDPYVIIKYSGKEYRTKVLNQAGFHPAWNQSFQLPVTSINERMQLVVMDKDITSDDQVGRTHFTLRQLGLINPKQSDRVLQLSYFKRSSKPVPAGTIKISTLFNF